MSGELPRLAAGRLRHAVSILCGVAAVGLVAEIALLTGRPEPALAPRDRSKEFLVPAAPDAATDDGRATAEAILARPLFVQGRGSNPPPAAAAVTTAPPPPAAAEPEIRLIGVQLSDDRRLALIKLSDSDSTLRAVEGQPVAGWTVARILRDHVVLTRNNRTRSIYLGDTKPPLDDEDASQ